MSGKILIALVSLIAGLFLGIRANVDVTQRQCDRIGQILMNSTVYACTAISQPAHQGEGRE